MEAVANQSWFLRKHQDGTVFGPLSFAQLQQWASAAQIGPHDKLSTDQQTWQKAPMYPELQMDWLVEVTSDHYYGPTTIGAIAEFVRLGEITEETFIINSCDGTRRPINEVRELLKQAEASSAAVSTSPLARSRKLCSQSRAYFPPSASNSSCVPRSIMRPWSSTR